MKLKDLESVLYSTRGSVQFAIVYDHEKNIDIANGCSIDYVVKEFGERELKRIEAFENQLLLIV